MITFKKRNTFLPPFAPSIGKKEINEVIDTLKSDWITTGPKVKTFEDNLKTYLKVKNVIAVSSCTAALHLSLIALGIKKNDEVILPSFTFISSVNTVLYQSATPVFVDIDKNTLNLSLNDLEKKISKKTKAIIPVHYGGQSCDLEKIQSLARKYNLKVIEDAAHAMGSEYKKRKIGTFADLTCFSFYATKTMTTGEGGAIATDNDALAGSLRKLRLFGMNKDAWKRYSSAGSWYYEIDTLGYKYNMTDIQAAIGIWQLKKLDSFIKRRQEIADYYNLSFKDLPEIFIPEYSQHVKHAWYLYPILINTDLLTVDRNQFIGKLKELNIGTSVHFIPTHLQPFYRNKFHTKPGLLPNTEYVYNRILSLPIYPKMKNKDVQDVVNAVRFLVARHKKS